MASQNLNQQFSLKIVSFYRAKAAKNKIVFDDDGNQEEQEEESDDDFNIEDASARLRQGKNWGFREINLEFCNVLKWNSEFCIC